MLAYADVMLVLDVNAYVRALDLLRHRRACGAFCTDRRDRRSSIDRELSRLHPYRTTEAKRLESIGQLVAGIAHDFNNILTVTKLAIERLVPGETEPSRLSALTDVRTVTDSAIALVRRLIGFAGNVRQVLAPIEVGSVIEPLVSLGQRTFDRRITVRAEGRAPAKTQECA